MRIGHLSIAATFVCAVGAIAFAANEPSSKSAAEPSMQLPPGWTMEDMQAMIVAGTPGKMHERLAGEVGSWKCKTTSWMGPESEPIMSAGISKITPLMDGRYVQVEMSGDMPGMGQYTGIGIYGYDNVSQKFVSTWIDNHGTGIMTGEGKLSDDGKSITWEYVGNCPITKQPMKMKEVDTNTSATTKKMEMWGPDPKSGKVYKMMQMDLTKE